MFVRFQARKQRECGGANAKLFENDAVLNQKLSRHPKFGLKIEIFLAYRLGFKLNGYHGIYFMSVPLSFDHIL